MINLFGYGMKGKNDLIKIDYLPNSFISEKYVTKLLKGDGACEISFIALYLFMCEHLNQAVTTLLLAVPSNI